MKRINPYTDIPKGMVGNLPWGTPLERWHTYMLHAGLEECDVTYFPRLRAAILAVLDTRRN